MLKSRAILLLAFVLLAVLLAAGLVHLFQLRFSRGDVYPPYSSLRADPLGTKAFHDALQRLESVEVQRWYERPEKLPAGAGRTLVVLGTPATELRWAGREELRRLEAFMNEGGRIVVLLRAEPKRTWWFDTLEKSRNNRSPRRATDEEGERVASTVSLEERWGFQIEFEDLELDEERRVIPDIALHTGDGSLPRQISWHSAIYFAGLTNAWRAIYTRNTNAVWIERVYGEGALVLASDSYHVSNEALRNDRHAPLLAWIVGENARVLFDEFHLGVQREPGIAELARQYRLHGFFIGLLLLAGLFVWKNSAALLPPVTGEEAGAAAIAGRESAAGFVNLLRRNLRSSDLLPLCLQEWKRSATRRRDSAVKLEQAEALLVAEQQKPLRERNPVATYRALTALLTPQSRAGILHRPGAPPAADPPRPSL